MMKTSQVDVNELLAAAEKIGQLAEEELQEAEKNATFSSKVIDAIKEGQLNRLMLPKKYGGPQVDLRTFIKIIRTVAKHNTSAAWLTYFYGLHNVVPAFLPEKGMDEVVNQGGMICDVFPPVGKVVKDGDGYRLTGTWDFASGILYCDWLGLGAVIELPDGQGPEYVMLVMRTSEIEIVENWDPIGLRGTGSHRAVVEDVYVPFHRIVLVDRAVQTGKPPQDNYDLDYPYYHVPFFPAYCAGFPAIALAGAERLLEEFKKRTEKRVRVDGVSEMNSPRSQRVLAELTLELQSAEGLMERYMNLLEDENGNDHREEFFALRAKIGKMVADIAVKVLLTLGGMATRRGDVIEVFTRDLLTLATHKTMLYEDSIDYFGQKLFLSESTLKLG